MAQGNKRQKPVDQLQFRRGGRGGTLRVLPRVSTAPREIPRAPRGLTEYARQVWRDFWASPLVGAIDINADRPALERWIAAVSERSEIVKAIGGDLTVRGSTGQDVLNPRYKRLAELDTQIQRAEEQFGMTPLARMRLGIAIRDGGASIERLKARLMEAQHGAARAGGDAPLDLESLQ